jgi:hypothetical protein
MFSSTLRSGFVEITPLGPTVLGANGLPQEKVGRVDDPLEANILILGPNANPLVVISCDLLYIGNALRDMVEFDLQDLVRPDRLFMGASHTHRATMTDSTKPALGRTEQGEIQAIAVTISRAVRAVHHQEERLVTAEVGYGHHDAGINRRRRRRLSVGRTGLAVNAVLMGPNRRGPDDRLIRRVRFLDSDGTEAAEVWSAALHPTGYPSRDGVSANFPGRVREAIRKDAGPDVAVAFLQGFSGDIRPNTPSTPLGLRRLLRGKQFVAFTPMQYNAWADGLVQSVRSVKFAPVQGEGISSVRTPVNREVFVHSAVGPRSGWVHGIRLGDLALVGVPSEVVVEYSSSLEIQKNENAGLKHVWGIGCIDHVWGYSPTQSMLAEGGYESVGFCTVFGVDRVNPNVESELRQALAVTVEALVISLGPER